MSFSKACDARHQPQTGKAGAAVDIQRVLHAVAQVFGGGVDGAQRTGHALQVLLASGGHFYPSGRALKQTHIQQAFEFGDLVTHGRRREVKLFGRQRKAFAASNGFKGLQGGEGRNHGLKSAQLLRCNMNEIELPMSLYRLSSRASLPTITPLDQRSAIKRRHACCSKTKWPSLLAVQV